VLRRHLAALRDAGAALWILLVFLIIGHSDAQEIDTTTFREISTEEMRAMVAAEEESQREWTIAAECHAIILPEKLALRLLPELSDGRTIEQAWKEVSEKIESGEIELRASSVARGRAGDRLVSEAVEEVRYPTEYDPPTIPDKFPPVDVIGFLMAWPVCITPTAFETRNVGHTLELNARVSRDGGMLDLDVATTDVRFLRWARYAGARLATGEELAVEQPIFHSMKNQSSLGLPNGKRVLLGIHKVPPPGKGFEVFIFKATATRSIE
jgi:hypothetical protein